MEAIGDKQYKVARVLMEVRDRTNIDPEEIFQRLCVLIESGILEGFGDLNRWRHSEVKKTKLLSMTALEAVIQSESPARKPMMGR